MHAAPRDPPDDVRLRDRRHHPGAQPQPTGFGRLPRRGARALCQPGHRRHQPARGDGRLQQDPRLYRAHHRRAAGTRPGHRQRGHAAGAVPGLSAALAHGADSVPLPRPGHGQRHRPRHLRGSRPGGRLRRQPRAVGRSGGRPAPGAGPAWRPAAREPFYPGALRMSPMTTTNPQRLQGKHALLTGAAGGMGLAVAQAYLQQGARCRVGDVADLAEHPAPQLQALLGQHPDALQYQRTDITQTDQVQALISAAARRFGPVSTLFNNAAIFDMAPLLESTEAMYDKLFAVNVKGAFFVMQKLLAHMLEHRVQGGSVINMASQAARRGEALVAHYCASKAAIISYTQSAALAMAPHGIRVNAIAPGVIATPMWEQVDALFAKYENLPPGAKKRQVGAAVPLGRMGAPDDICGAAVFLASDEARYVTAQTLNVDGGNVMS